MTHRRWLDADRFAEALSFMRKKAGARFVTLMGGEPLPHPRIAEMARTASEMGAQPATVTNGWLLPGKLDAIAGTGISTVFVSIHSEDAAAHEKNRGLKGVRERIRGSQRPHGRTGINPIASVATSRLIGDCQALGRFPRELGFATVTFSYPRKASLGASSSVRSEDSDPVDLSAAEPLAAFDAVDEARAIIPVHNPRASIADMRRRLRGGAERFHRLAGDKHSYLDWNYDFWRCEDWSAPMCPVWEFEPRKTVRDGCRAAPRIATATPASCCTSRRRWAAFARMSEGRPIAAAAALADRRNAASLGAVIGHGSRLARLLAGVG